MKRTGIQASSKTVATQKPPIAPPIPGTEKSAGGGPQKKSQPLRHKQYILRLEKQGLPTEAAPRSVQVPTQFQLTVLANGLPAGTCDRNNPAARVQRALELWHAAGGLLDSQKRARVVADGLLYFSADDWQRHVQALILALDDSCYTEQATANDESQAAETPASKGDSGVRQTAAGAVEAYWQRRTLTNADVLRAIFYGKNDQNPQIQMQMFYELLEYAKRTLDIEKLAPLSDDEIREARQRPDLFGEGNDELAAWSSSLQEAWTPLGACPQRAAWHLVELARQRIADAQAFAVGQSLADYACVARWCVVMRQRQVSDTKRRFPK